jgi:hypothetical protein
MQLPIRLDRLLPAGALLAGAALAAGGGYAQGSTDGGIRSSADPAEICRDCGPPGPDLCVTVTFPDGSRLTCYEVRSTRIRDGSDDTVEGTASEVPAGR